MLPRVTEACGRQKSVNGGVSMWLIPIMAWCDIFLGIGAGKVDRLIQSRVLQCDTAKDK